MLIAIALLGALLGAMSGFFFNMLSSRAQATDHARQHNAAATVIERLDAELQACIVGDQRTGAGVDGDATSLKILSRGVAANLADRGANADSFGDLQFTECTFDAAQDRLQMRRGPAGRESASTVEPLEGTVHKLRFRYLDGATWRSSFDSLAAKRLPVAVEVALWLTPVADDENNVDVDENSAVPPSGILDSALGDAHEPAFSELEPLGDNEPRDLPPPDRLRVIIIPDAGEEVAP